MTAVEYLVKEFSKHYAIHQLEDEINNAKQMEKNQIEDAYSEGDTFPQGYLHSKDYYKKNYGDYNPPKEVNEVSFGEISDERIVKYSEKFWIGQSYFIYGAKWMREQLKSIHNEK
jgi:hypothetical protein